MATKENTTNLYCLGMKLLSSFFKKQKWKRKTLYFPIQSWRLQKQCENKNKVSSSFISTPIISNNNTLKLILWNNTQPLYVLMTPNEELLDVAKDKFNETKKDIKNITVDVY